MIKPSELQALVGQGIINEEQALKIINFQKQTNVAGGGFSQSIVTIGTILVGLGVLSLVALNREGMTDLFKIAIMLIALVVSYLSGRYFKEQGKKLVGGSLLFLSGLLVGTSIFLIAQVYNLTVTNDVLLGVRIILILPLVYLVKQKEFYYLYLILLSCVLAQFLMSHVFVTSDRRDPIVLYILFGIGLTLVGYMHEKRYDDALLAKLYKVFGVNIAMGAYFIFIASSEFEENIYLFPTSIIRISVGVLLGILIRGVVSKERDMWYLVSALLAMMVGIVMYDTVLINYCVFILLCLTIIYLGYKHHNNSVIKTANVYLYVFLLYLYGRYGWEYENKAMFFIGGGVLMISLGVGFSKLNSLLPTFLAPVSQHNE